MSQQAQWTPPEPPPARDPRVNGLARASLLLGIFGLVLLAVPFAAVALGQIRRRGGRGRAMAVAGLTLSGVWVAAGVVVSVALVVGFLGNTEGKETPLGSSLRDSMPRTGQCFNLHEDETRADVKVISCEGPHDAQVVAVFSLPEGEWPGEKEASRRTEAECDRRLVATFGTRWPVARATPYVIYPRKLSWLGGDRSAVCSLAGDGKKLTAPIKPHASGKRELGELAVGDCYKFPPDKEAVTVDRVPCTKPHDSQVVSRFTLAGGPWPGKAAVERMSARGCDARMTAHFRKHRSPVRVAREQITPTKETWELGDRLALCVVSAADGGPLRRSVIGG